MVSAFNDPADIPVTLEDGSEVFLTIEGGYQLVEGGQHER